MMVAAEIGVVSMLLDEPIASLKSLDGKKWVRNRTHKNVKYLLIKQTPIKSHLL